MANFPIPLNDCELLKLLTEEFGRGSFLSAETKKYISKIRKILSNETIEKDFKYVFNTARKDGIDVLDFWERLIIDAIKYLKWHDSKEFTKNNEFPNQKSAYDKISEGSLGVYNLKEYFKTFIDFERLLYGAEQFYRDHVYHILKVWLIGQYIINKIFDDKLPISIAEDEHKLAMNGTPHFKCSKKNKGTLYAGEDDAVLCKERTRRIFLFISSAESVY